MITFDDGWRGTVDVAGHILEAYGLQGLLFVTTDLIGHPLFVDRHHLQALGLTFSVGSHARSHRLLAELSEREVRSELCDSKALLEDILGREVDAIAYPGGSFDRRVLEMTKEAGYRFVFTSQPAINSLTHDGQTLGRLAVKRSTTGEALSRWIRGDIRREMLRAAGLRATKTLLGPLLYRNLRSWLITEDRSHLEMTDLISTTTAGLPWNVSALSDN